MFGRIVIVGLLLQASLVLGQETANEAPDPQSNSAAQFVYKGVVGNLLEAVPLDPDDRVRLQRLNALVSGPLGARSLAAAFAIASPPLLIVGVIWGLWSASRIEVAATQRTASGPQANPYIALNEEAITRGGDVLALETRYVASTSLAAMVGGAAAAVSMSTCDSCVMPLLYSRAMPPTR